MLGSLYRRATQPVVRVRVDGDELQHRSVLHVALEDLCGTTIFPTSAVPRKVSYGTLVNDSGVSCSTLRHLTGAGCRTGIAIPLCGRLSPEKGFPRNVVLNYRPGLPLEAGLRGSTSLLVLQIKAPIFPKSHWLLGTSAGIPSMLKMPLPQQLICVVIR